jgi:hypothetical protein
MNELRTIVPDLQDQYTLALDPIEYERYWEIKLRALHAFQIRCAREAIAHLNKPSLTVADIGDSAGTHGTYLRGLDTSGQIGRFVSVNLDAEAVDKIKRKGGEAVLCRAENLKLNGLQPDLFLSFETVEHLTDPARFLHDLATSEAGEFLLMTVPYRRHSRFGGAHLHMDESLMPDQMTAEEVHIYEFSPADWQRLARFAGFRPVFTRSYWQYPRNAPLRLTSALWRRLDFEGFFAMFLQRDLGVANRYTAW